MRNLCIVIPTHERHQYLARCIGYYGKFDCSVMVCDSSAGVYQAAFPDNVIYCHLPGKMFAEKILFALSACTQDFIALSPDDDFLFEEALYKGLEVLHQRLNVQACVGDVLGYPDIPPFRVVSRASGSGVINATSADPKMNIQNYLFNYHQILWSLFRREALEVSFSLIRKAAFSNENFFELTIAAICAGKGGVYYMDDYWILRELSSIAHWGTKHKPLTRVESIESHSDMISYLELVDNELFPGAGELALSSYLSGQRATFIWRVVGFIRRQLNIKNINLPILQNVKDDPRFSRIIIAIEAVR